MPPAESDKTKSDQGSKLPDFKAKYVGTGFAAGYGTLPRFEVNYEGKFRGIRRRLSGEAKPSEDLVKEVSGHWVIVRFSCVHKDDIGKNWQSRITNLEQLVAEYYDEPLIASEASSTSKQTRGRSNDSAGPATGASVEPSQDTVQTAADSGGNVPEISVEPAAESSHAGTNNTL